jgi:hypothetical protein
MAAPSPPVGVYPKCTQLLQIGLESGGFGVTPAQAAFASAPIVDFKPDNKVTWVEDGSMWGDFTKTHDVQQGPLWAESDIAESPLYCDTFGHFLYNLMSDLVETGTASTPTWTTSGALTAGAGPVAVTSATSAVAGTLIQVDTGVNAEVVKVGTGSTATSIVLDATTPLRFSHLTTIAVVTVIAPFSHTFSLLNPYGSTGVVTGQGPTHSLIHRNNIPGAGNNYAWLFPYGCMSEITINAKASGILTWSGKVTSYAKAYPSFIPVPGFSAVRMIPGWKSTTTVASTLLDDITVWSATLTRKVTPKNTGDGYQQPYLIGRGNFDCSFKLTYDPALDESALTNMLTNAQPTLAWSIGNGGSGTGLWSFALAANQAAYKTAPLSGDEFFGFDVSGDFVSNVTNSGNSGGRSPCSITLQNALPTYA